MAAHSVGGTGQDWNKAGARRADPSNLSDGEGEASTGASGTGGWSGPGTSSAGEAPWLGEQEAPRARESI